MGVYNSVYNTMYKISIMMRKTTIGKRIFFFMMVNLGGRAFLEKIFSQKQAVLDQKNPTDKMIASRKFFSENESRVNNVINMLADDESKATYAAMIEFRQTSDLNVLPDECSMRKQYFFNNFFKYQEGEVLVECGAFDGDTIYSFKKAMHKNKIKKYNVIAFEPDEMNRKQLSINQPDSIVLPVGVWNKDDTLIFNDSQHGSSGISEVALSENNGGGGICAGESYGQLP